MKTWEKYRVFLQKGEWHIHTNFTDGRNTIEDYCIKAENIGIPLISFTEHVRRETNYSFNDFLYQIENAREKYDVIIISGCEAKVLPIGKLDVSKSIINKVDYVVFSYHSFPKDLNLYLKTLKKIITNKYVNTWGHPGLFLKNNKYYLENRYVKEILELMRKYKVLLENNCKYNLPFDNWKYLAKKIGVKMVRGSDVHSVYELYA